MRTDRGTENGIMATAQCFLKRNDTDSQSGINAHRYWSSHSNQRIEAWWAYLRRSWSSWWIDFFKDIVDGGSLDLSDKLHCECLWFCFSNLVQNELDQVRGHWNSHYIRVSRYHTPSGIPDQHPPPHGTHDIPHMHHDTPTVLNIPHGTQDNPPTVLKISPHGTEHPWRYSRYPPHLSWYPPTVLKISPTVLMISPTVLNTPTVLHTHYTGWFSRIEHHLAVRACFNPPMAKGGVDATPSRFFQVLLGMGRFFAN